MYGLPALSRCDRPRTVGVNRSRLPPPSVPWAMISQ